MIQYAQSRRALVLLLLTFLTVSVGIIWFISLRGVGNGDQTDPITAKATIPDVIKHSEFSDQVIANPVPSAVQGRGVGLVRPSDLSIPPFERPQTEEFQLTSGASFAPYLILVSQDDNPLTTLVTVLVDYNQTPFELDGRMGLLHEVVIPPHTELNLPLRLMIEGAGAHDLIFIAFVDPYSHILDVNRRDTELGNIMGRRAVIIVDGRQEPFKTISPIALGQDAPSNLASVPIRIGFAAAPSEPATHPSERPIVLAGASPGEMFSFQVWVTNFGDQLPVEYGMVGFLNYHQVPLNQHQVTAVQLGSGRQEVILDVNVMVPETAVIHEFQVVYVLDPYESILHEQVTASFVFSTVRLGLDAR